LCCCCCMQGHSGVLLAWMCQTTPARCRCERACVCVCCSPAGALCSCRAWHVLQARTRVV
jgi:hypothetical protein